MLLRSSVLGGGRAPHYNAVVTATVIVTKSRRRRDFRVIANLSHSAREMPILPRGVFTPSIMYRSRGLERQTDRQTDRGRNTILSCALLQLKAPHTTSSLNGCHAVIMQVLAAAAADSIISSLSPFVSVASS